MIKKIISKKPTLLPKDERVKSALVSAASVLVRAKPSPDDEYGDLFRDVQISNVYPDGKSFVDLVPRKRSREIKREYKLAREDPNFDLKDFVSRHFYEFVPTGTKEYHTAPGIQPRQHIRNLWKILERRNRKARGSLFAVPYKYIVPGGRFQEQFYWDTYFIMLGLAADGHWDMIRGMMKNYTYMIRRFGFIPSANRSYYLSRSQPPFFSYMVRLLGTYRGQARTYLEYLPSLLAEYRFWMKGRRYINDHLENQSYGRVVRMPDGSVLNRYYDNKTTPRPESMRDDVANADKSKSINKGKIFLDFRAGAESGWDFSSRWFTDPNDIQTIHTTDIVPVDLNALLYHHEMLIAETYGLIHQPLLKRKFKRLAESRAKSIMKYCWDEDQKFFCDYNFRTGLSTGRLTLAGVFPLYAKIASAEQARHVAEIIKKDFLKPGGLVTTLVKNGEQWDAPNGWAPLQWVAIRGLREYGYHELADLIRKRWLRANDMVFANQHKMLEKYNVVNTGNPGAGGEYPVQDGFGWTNGVYAALYDDMDGTG